MIPEVKHRRFHIKSPIKLTISLFLVVYSLVVFMISPTTDRQYCMLAMVVSGIGDMLMMGQISLSFLPVSDFVAGAGAFVVAHILYGVAYFHRFCMDAGRNMSFNGGTVIVLAGLVVLILVFWAICIWKAHYEFIWLIPVYLCFIGVSCGAVFTYVWEVYDTKPSVIWAAVGAGAFLFSDCCIGLNRVAGWRWMRKLVWVFYPIGQLLLITCG